MVARIGGRLRKTASRVRGVHGTEDRRDEYARLLAASKRAGYELVGLQEFHERAPVEGEDWRALALRHDVDIRDVDGNEAFLAVERSVEARATYYFRMSTAGPHADLIRRLLRGGFEVGYHYEEGATVAKRHGLTSRAALEARRSEVAALFRDNCAEFRNRWNPGLSSVASHGDWINGRLGFANSVFVTPQLLSECGLRFEAYAGDFLSGFDVYVSDAARYPARWANEYGVYEAMRDGRRRICLLTHERRWHPSCLAGLAADAGRVADGARYEWNRRRQAGARRRRAGHTPGGTSA